MPNLKPFAQCGLAAVTAATLAGPAQASGFRVPEISAAGLGTSNALVANTSEPGALPYNPAAMSFHQGNQLVAGVTLIQPDMSVTPDGGTKTDTVGKDTFTVPNIYLKGEASGDWSWGIGINAPFGLEVRWPKDTFPVFAGPLDTAEPELSKLKMVNFNPNVSRKVGPNTSIAFGINFYEVRNVALNTHGLNVEGSGDGIGFNIGIIHQQGKWTVGGSYRSPVETDISGAVHGYAATTSIEFPAMLQVGAAYQASSRVLVELDVDWTGWSSFDKVEISAPTAPSPIPTQITSTNKWDDSTGVRLGVTWQISPKTRVRFGYSVEETPQPDEYFSARIPDNDRQFASIGFTHDMGGWSIEGGYMYVKVDDRTVNSQVSYAAKALGGDTDPNGTDAFNGKYESSANLLAIGITKRF